jgi:aspartate/methionine/tyrosine aminotransferase
LLTAEQPNRRSKLEKELEMVVRVAKEHNLLVFSDDIYDKFVYENSAERVYLGQLYDKTITFGGFPRRGA